MVSKVFTKPYACIYFGIKLSGLSQKITDIIDSFH